MKILLISDTVFDQNGVSRFIQDMASEAKKNDKDFHVLTSSPLHLDNLSDNIINMKPLYSRTMPFYPELFVAFPRIDPFLRKIKEFNPDILHISTPGPVGMLALYASYKYKIPFASTYHTDFPSYLVKNLKNKFAGRVCESLMRFFYKKAELVISRSSAYLQIIEEDIKIDKEKIYELKAGTDIDKFNPSHKNDSIWEDYGIDKDSVKMLYVGRLSIEKNFQWLLRLYEKNKSYFNENNITFVVVGHGKILKKTAKMKEMNVHMLGIRHVPELSCIYASSDFFITPSVTETLGQVVLEAMASGLPCIVTNEGGPAKLVNADSENGFVLEPLNEELWLDSIKSLVNSQELRVKMGERSFNYIQNFSISVTFESFWKVHEEMYKKSH